jgi:hypothetical protein
MTLSNITDIVLHSSEVLADRQIKDAVAKLQAHTEAIQKLLVVDESTFAQASEMATILQKAEKFLDEKRKMLKQPYKEKADAIDADFKKLLEPIAALREILRDKRNAFLREQERRRQEALQEQQRIQREQEEKQRRIQEELAKKHAEEAARAEGKGEAVLPPLEPIVTPPPPVAPPEVPQVPRRVQTLTGSSTARKIWLPRVVDRKALYRAIAEGDVSEEAAPLNEVYLRKLAKATDGRAYCPGVEFYEDFQMVDRG